MKVTHSFTFAGVEYQVGDDFDLNGLEPDDRADLISRGVFDEEQEQTEKKTSKSKTEVKEKTK